jgi:hypothetical protein
MYIQPDCEICDAPGTICEGIHIWCAMCYIRIHKLVLKGKQNERENLLAR